MIQVKTNGLGLDTGQRPQPIRAPRLLDLELSRQGRHVLRRLQQDGDLRQPAERDYDLLPGRVPTGSGGQILNVRLYDVGDSAGTGTISVLAPSDSNVSFTSCKGVGPIAGNLTNCSIAASSATHQGKWQTIAVNIPSNYACDDNSATGCWVKLKYAYGSGNQPNDTTSWRASIEGDPVRLVE